VTEYLEMADALLIAEAVLGIPAESLAKTERIGLLESAVMAPAASFEGAEFYPDLAVKAAVLAGHIAKNHGLPDGNKRVAFLAMVEFLERNGYEWTPPPGDEDGEITDRVIRAIAASELSGETIAEFTAWIKSCTGL
jgi:death-on-curing protein